MRVNREKQNAEPHIHLNNTHLVANLLGTAG